MATEVDETTVKVEVSSQEGQTTNIADPNVDANDKIKYDSYSDQDQADTDNHNNNDNNNNDDDDNYDDQVGDDVEGDKQMSPRNNNESIEESDKTNLIVNYLPQQMTDEQFKSLFEKYGPMKSCKIVRNKSTGYSYGFGFADYETHEQALKAIEELNGHEVDTKKIKVAFARPAGQDIKQANLYVKGIPNSWSQDDVKKVFDPYGQIIQVRVLGNERGIAFVLFDLRRQAEEAMEALNAKTVEGCDGPLEIKFAADKKSEKRGGNRQGGGTNQGRRRGQDRGRRREGGRSLSNNRGNSGNNNSNQRRGTSQQSRGSGGRGMFNKQNNNTTTNNNYNNNQMNNGGVGPMRQQHGGRANRYAPFAPMQQTPMQPTAAPGMVPYGYPAQPMMQYMMPGQMMQMGQISQLGHHTQQPQQPQQMQMAGHAINPYAQMGYAPPAAMAQSATAMTNMYNMASSTMNNAAQMQPQLGQPMNTRAVTSGTSNAPQGGGSNNSSDGVTMFVYNIGPNSDESELKSMFEPYGEVIRCNVVRKTPGGETKGFGFVTVRNRNQANAAISALNGEMRNGKMLQVSFKK